MNYPDNKDNNSGNDCAYKSIILNLKSDIAKFMAKTPTAAPITGTNKILWEQPITRDKITTNIAVMITAYFFIVITPYKTLNTDSVSPTQQYHIRLFLSTKSAQLDSVRCNKKALENRSSRLIFLSNHKEFMSSGLRRTHYIRSTKS